MKNKPLAPARLKKIEEFQNNLGSVEILERVLSNLPGIVFWKNKDSMYMGCNQILAKLFNARSPKDIIGRTDFEFQWGKEEARRVIGDDQEVMLSKQPKLNIIEALPIKNGSIMYVITNKVPLYDKNGEVVGILGTATDITKQIETEKALQAEKEKAEAANQAKSNFLATMSHELRTPLNGILGMAQILRSKKLDQEAKEYALAIEQSGQNLLALVNDILDIAKLEAGKVAIEQEPFSLSKLLNEIEISMRLTISHKPIKFIFQCDEDVPSILMGDKRRMRQILVNLIGNAVKFTTKGRIKTTAHLKKKTEGLAWIEIKVEDTGIGIPDNKLQTIFERFTQVESQYNRRFDGAGLGLAITKSLLDMMNANITVKSKLDKGTTFKLTIPFKILTHTRQGRVQGLRSGKANKEALNLNILLVEDNEINQRVADSMLRSFGCKVDIAATGGEATELYKKHQYDLVLMDLSLPDQDGIQITKKLLSLKKGSAPPPIVAVTAHVLQEDRQRCLDVGMNDVITKPLIKEELEAQLKHWTQS